MQRRRIDRGALAWCVALICVACDPQLADRFLCGAGGACPDGLSCAVDGICRAQTTDVVVDASVTVDLIALPPPDLSIDIATMSLPDLITPSFDASSGDLSGCMKVKCDDHGERECGWTDDHCGTPLFCGFCQMGKMCGKKKPNQCD